jgi:hypothetical protein
MQTIAQRPAAGHSAARSVKPKPVPRRCSRVRDEQARMHAHIFGPSATVAITTRRGATTLVRGVRDGNGARLVVGARRVCRSETRAAIGRQKLIATPTDAPCMPGPNL